MESMMTKILIDQSHNQAWAVDPEVAARMNPANPADASYEQAALTLADSGFTVSTHESGPIDATALEGIDVLLIPHASTSDWEKTIGTGSPVLTHGEISAIESFVAGGGALLLLGVVAANSHGLFALKTRKQLNNLLTHAVGVGA
jgi:hypothetical protein